MIKETRAVTFEDSRRSHVEVGRGEDEVEPLGEAAVLLLHPTLVVVDVLGSKRQRVLGQCCHTRYEILL